MNIFFIGTEVVGERREVWMCVNRIRRCCVILLKCVHPPTVERERRVEDREEERKELIALGRTRGFLFISLVPCPGRAQQNHVTAPLSPLRLLFFSSSRHFSYRASLIRRVITTSFQRQALSRALAFFHYLSFKIFFNFPKKVKWIFSASGKIGNRTGRVYQDGRTRRRRSANSCPECGDGFSLTANLIHHF